MSGQDNSDAVPGVDPEPLPGPGSPSEPRPGGGAGPPMGHLTVDGEPRPITAEQAATLPQAPDEAPPRFVLRSLAWTDRMTMHELGGITLAASRGMEGGDPTLQVFLDTLGRATEVDVTDPRFKGALEAFVQLGLLDADRLPDLLAPAAPGEAPS